MTLTELRLIAALAHIGVTSPNAASGTLTALSMNASRRPIKTRAEPRRQRTIAAKRATA